MTTLIIIGVAIYFFIAGVLFMDMLSETLLTNRAFFGALAFSLLWIPFLIWVGISTFSKTSMRWYIEFGKKIFGGG